VVRSLALRVAPVDVEEVLDLVIDLAPQGVHELERNGDAELVMFGTETELPDDRELRRLCGDLLLRIDRRSAPAAWRERRLVTYRPTVFGDRLAVRPDWAPPSASGLIDIALVDEGSFGTGTHPTTRACLTVLTGITPQGSFADLGCGSGVLAIAAAALGFSPVLAVDADRAATTSATENAKQNGASVQVRRLDLNADAPPGTDLVAANVPLAVHRGIASRLSAETTRVLVSGVGETEAEALLEIYAETGLARRDHHLDRGWLAILLERL
jgi:ribosomal protein L11 methyltransferase